MLEALPREIFRPGGFPGMDAGPKPAAFRLLACATLHENQIGEIGGSKRKKNWRPGNWGNILTSKRGNSLTSCFSETRVCPFSGVPLGLILTFRENLRKPTKNDRFWKEQWLKRKEQESTSRIVGSPNKRHAQILQGVLWCRFATRIGYLKH